MTSANRPSKICATCGRQFQWRRSWARDWDEVRYCSQACRRSKPGARERKLEAKILEMLAAKPGNASICPSDVARSVQPDDWRPLMEPVRRAARRLVAAGAVEITQGGRKVDPSTARGPIRIRLRK
jgi:hypothetical protein